MFHSNLGRDGGQSGFQPLADTDEELLRVLVYEYPSGSRATLSAANGSLFSRRFFRYRLKSVCRNIVVVVDGHGIEKKNWGLVSLMDNAYDGVEAGMAQGIDAWGYPTGGEENNYGDFIGPARADELFGSGEAGRGIRETVAGRSGAMTSVPGNRRLGECCSVFRETLDANS